MVIIRRFECRLSAKILLRSAFLQENSWLFKYSTFQFSLPSSFIYSYRFGWSRVIGFLLLISYTIYLLYYLCVMNFYITINRYFCGLKNSIDIYSFCLVIFLKFEGYLFLYQFSISLNLVEISCWEFGCLVSYLRSVRCSSLSAVVNVLYSLSHSNLKMKSATRRRFGRHL